MSQMSRFWDATAKKYAASPVKNETAWHQTLSSVRSHLGPSSRVFEIGAGTGSTALKLAPHAGYVLSTDFSGSMVDIAREKLEAPEHEGIKDKLQFEVLDICRPMGSWKAEDPCTKQKGTFDVALAFNLLYLLEDVPQTIKNVNGMLKPGGLFISKNMVSDGMDWKYKLAERVIPIIAWAGYAPQGVKFMSTKELEGTMRDAGFEVVESVFPEGDGMRRFVVARKEKEV